jgi:hypothetical protein
MGRLMSPSELRGVVMAVLSCASCSST